MALAPRPQFGSRKPRHGSSTTDAPGKAAQRARNKAAGLATRSGSSGEAKRIADYPRKSWEELSEGAVHLTDIAGKISHSQLGASGWLVTTLNSPAEYAHDMLDAHLKGKHGMVYMRIYYVPIELYLDGTDGHTFLSADQITETTANGD